MNTDLAFASTTTLMAAQSVEVYEVMYDKIKTIIMALGIILTRYDICDFGFTDRRWKAYPC